MVHTEERIAASGRICDAAKDLTKDKAALAAMMAEAFINGMNAQDLMTRTADAAPRPEPQT